MPASAPFYLGIKQMAYKIDLDLEESLSEKLSNLWWRFIKRPIKFFIQRRKRGFDDSELWELAHYTAKFIYPRLKAFREMDRVGYPCTSNIAAIPDPDKPDEQKEIDVWNEKLDKMIAAFDLILNEDKKKKFDFDEWLDNINNDPYTKEEHKKTDEGYKRQRKIKEEGLKLFAEYFETLWD